MKGRVASRRTAKRERRGVRRDAKLDARLGGFHVRKRDYKGKGVVGDVLMAIQTAHVDANAAEWTLHRTHKGARPRRHAEPRSSHAETRHTPPMTLFSVPIGEVAWLIRLVRFIQAVGRTLARTRQASIALSKPVHIARVMVHVLVALACQIRRCCVRAHSRFAIHHNLVVHSGLTEAMARFEFLVRLGKLCWEASNCEQQRRGTTVKLVID